MTLAAMEAKRGENAAVLLRKPSSEWPRESLCLESKQDVRKGRGGIYFLWTRHVREGQDWAGLKIKRRLGTKHENTPLWGREDKQSFLRGP